MESLENWLTRPEGMATRLRALRAQADLSGKELANTHGWQQSKVSRIERGKQMPTPDDIRAWARTCGAEPGVIEELLRLHEEARVAHLMFRDRMRQGQKQVQESYSDLIANSRMIRYFETAYVPGVLQVPGYARRVLHEMISLHNLEIDDVEAAVTERMQWQQMLYDPDKSFEFLLGESVLRWLLCSPAVMREQLDRLQTVIGLERIRFGILPMGVELPWTPQNSFQLYVGEEQVAAVETFIGETFHRDDQAEAYGRALDRLWDEAETGERARELIVAAARALPGGETM